MDNLLPIGSDRLAEETVSTVNARDLHQFLEVGRDFSNWIKDRIEEYGFIENQDYVRFSPKLAKTSQGGRPSIDYHLSIDMGKELSMVERNEKGRQARRYFIACERRAKAAQHSPLGVERGLARLEQAALGLAGCATQTLADGQAALETLRQDLAACLVAASQAKPPVSPEASARARKAANVRWERERARKAAQKLGGGHGCRA